MKVDDPRGYDIMTSAPVSFNEPARGTVHSEMRKTSSSSSSYRRLVARDRTNQACRCHQPVIARYDDDAKASGRGSRSD